MSRAFGALSLEEERAYHYLKKSQLPFPPSKERHLLLGKAHLALAAKCRTASVEETREAIEKAVENEREHRKELEEAVAVASSEVLAERATMLAVLRGCGDFLERCSPEFRNDPEIVLAACEADEGWAFAFASLELQADREFVLQAVRLGGYALRWASRDLRADREVVLAALHSASQALDFASDHWRRDRDLILASLQQMTRRMILKDETTVLDLVSDEIGPVSDKELILEAARVDEQVLAFASLELRQDKDFVLEVMRRFPREGLELCYEEAHDSVKRAAPFGDFQGACNSALASPGEEAPVLTVTVLPTAVPTPENSHEQKLLPAASCEVTLLSGTSFTCSLATADADPSSHLAAAAKETGRESKRQRMTANPLMNVSRLAEIVKAELLAHTQAHPPPARVFIVFNKRDAEGESISVPVTPWDWNRPVSDFC